jgi:hypothetical protein
VESEKKNKADVLSFDFILKTFLYEFNRRRKEDLQNGYELYKIEAPQIK